MKMVSLSKGDWTKLRQILQRIVTLKWFASDMKTGTSQSNAKAAKGELWCDSSDGFKIKLGQ